MARGYLGIILVAAFIVADLILIFIVNTSRVLPVVGVITPSDQLLITYVLVGAAVLAAIAAVLWKLKPWK